MNKIIKEYIKSDYLRYRSDCTKSNVIKQFIRNKPFRYSVLMRVYKVYTNENRSIMIKIVRVLKSMLFLNSTIEIPLDIEVGKGIYMGHFSGITINPKAIIGNNVNIHKGVTIGQENRGKRKGTPVIGNRVWIGINSTIVGNIKIGDNVLISPNSFVNFDVPSDSIVIGNKIKKSNNATEGYIHNICVY